MLVRRWLKDYQSLYGFRLLGAVTAIHLAAVAAITSWKWFYTMRTSHSVEDEPVPSGTTGRKCPLCLEERKRVSATPCGHLFCWSCILEWLQTQNQCPLCRERVEPSRVIPLQNYVWWCQTKCSREFGYGGGMFSQCSSMCVNILHLGFFTSQC